VRLDLAGFQPGTAAHFRACLWGDSWNGTVNLSDHYATVTLMEDGVEGAVVGSAEWDNLNHAVIEGDIAGDLASTWLKIRTPPREIYPGTSLSDESNVAWVEIDYYRSLVAAGGNWPRHFETRSGLATWRFGSPVAARKVDSNSDIPARE